MAFRRGNLAKVRKVSNEVKKRQNNTWVRRLTLEDGDSVTVWFGGNIDLPPEKKGEPYLAQEHYIKGVGYFWCPGDGCAACEAAEDGDPRIRKNPSDVAAFNVFDVTIYHKIKSKTKGRKWDYEVCSEDRRCSFCRDHGREDVDEPRDKDDKTERMMFRGGQKLAKWAVSHADGLGAADEQVAEKCKCRKGDIKVEGYDCPECEEPIDDWCPDPEAEDVEKVKCKECKCVVEPKEYIECTADCGKPKRATIFQYGCPVTIQRTGESTNTKYQFFPKWPPPTPPEYVLDAEMLDLPDVCAPESNEVIAQAIYKRGSKSGGSRRAARDEGGSRGGRKREAEHESYDDDEDKGYGPPPRDEDVPF